MTKPNVDNHDVARGLIETGQWRVDATAGLVFGKKGCPFRRTNSWGYVQVKFRDPQDWRRERSVLAHRLVWEYVHGALPAGLEINHKNGNKQDNRLCNLEAVDHCANVSHAHATGLIIPTRGMSHPRARLTDADVLDIYRRAWSGEPQASIAREYGVQRESVSNIKCGWAWRHVTGHQPTVA